MPDSATGAALRGFTVKRTFDSPRELVWRAWTEPAHFSQWFGLEGSSIPLETASMDVRPGGEWSVVMHTPEGELPFRGRYLEVNEPEKLVLTLYDFEDPLGPNVETMTVRLRDLGDGRTEIEFAQEGHLSDEDYVLTKEGTSAFFDRLATHLATAKTAA